MIKIFVLTKLLAIKESEVSALLYKSRFYELSENEHKFIRIKIIQIKELSNDIASLYNEHKDEILSLANGKSRHLKLIKS